MILWIWNDMRVSNDQIFIFCVNYPFNARASDYISKVVSSWKLDKPQFQYVDKWLIEMDQ